MSEIRVEALRQRCLEFAAVAQNESICLEDAGCTLGEITRAEFRYLAEALAKMISLAQE